MVSLVDVEIQQCRHGAIHTLFDEVHDIGNTPLETIIPSKKVIEGRKPICKLDEGRPVREEQTQSDGVRRMFFLCWSQLVLESNSQDQPRIYGVLDQHLQFLVACVLEDLEGSVPAKASLANSAPATACWHLLVLVDVGVFEVTIAEELVLVQDEISKTSQHLLTRDQGECIREIGPFLHLIARAKIYILSECTITFKQSIHRYVELREAGDEIWVNKSGCKQDDLQQQINRAREQ